jgi:uncharacterized protein (TIGR03435 family)
MAKIIVSVAVAFLSGIAAAQSTPPGFEVASVKRAGDGVGQEWSMDPGQVSFTGTLKSLLFRAYGAKNYQISAPPWLWKDNYEIIAKLPEGTREDQVPAMLQRLLADRLGIVAHWETKPRAVYSLTVGKRAVHLKESSETENRMGVSFTTQGHMEFKRATLAGFAESLSNFLDRPVIDATGLPGRFDIALDVSMEDLAGMKKLLSASGAPPEAAAGVGESNVPLSIFIAIQELGLKLESRTAPIRYLVVDRANKVPTGN